VTVRTAIVLVFLLTGSAFAQTPPLVVLQPTGETRNSLPVFRPHPQGPVVAGALTRGFSGRLLRLYAMEQAYLHLRTGAAPEPAYLLLSDRQGGFPEFGFVLDTVQKPTAGYVDLPRSQTIIGRFGAMDQIFPHELMHIIVRQLAGTPRESGANQVHAVGVRTDPPQAFNEGFAEHVQILSVDDPDAARETSALVDDAQTLARARRELDAFARELDTRLLLISPSRMRFLLWFSQSEQVLRYWEVKANAFARAPAIPARLLQAHDKYGAYLFRSVMPGEDADPHKSAAELLSTEGAVAHLAWRFVTSPALGERVREPAFYEMFGAHAAGLSPLDNVYLKMFHALYVGKPSDTAGFLRSYVNAFPDEAATVEALTLDVLFGQPLPDAPEIWLANEALQTGTSLFDQFRGLPRPHTFDINAASAFDWLTVPGVTAPLADRLVRGAPYRRITDLTDAADVPPALRTRILDMAAAMDDLFKRAHEEEASLSLTAIALPYLWRLAALVTLATGVGGWLARRAGIRRWWTAGLIAVMATLLVLTLAWVITGPAWLPYAAPLMVGGLPAALWRLARRQPLRRALSVLGAWLVAMLPAVALSRAWF
jgi:hypothetical protein